VVNCPQVWASKVRRLGNLQSPVRVLTGGDVALCDGVELAGTDAPSHVLLI